MARAPQSGESLIETWEIQTEGTVWVWTYDRRNDRYTKQRVGGRQGGSRILRISSDDRRYNQEQIVDELKETDPFINGALRLTSKERAEDVDATYHLGPDELRAMLEVKDMDLFQVEVGDIKSELILRRLRDVAELHGTVQQLTYVSELIEGRYKVGGTQKTVREMLDAGEELSGTRLS